MAGGYDGSIKFDTSISPKGFNAGIKRIGSSMQGVMTSISKGFGKAVAAIGSVIGAVVGVAAAIVGIITVLVSAGFAIFAWAQKFTDTLYKSLSVTSAYRAEVVQLKGAFDTLKGAMMGLGISLLSALAPAIRTVINWLVTAINWASQFIAALSGATTYNKYISGSASGAGQAAKNADKLAKNTDKAGKAAKGALAGFDQLNVLQQETADLSDIQDFEGMTGGGGAGSGGNMVFQETAIDSNILTIAGKIKKFFEEVRATAAQLMVIIGYYATIAWEWIKQAGIDAWNWIKQAFIDTCHWIDQAAVDTANWIKQAWSDASAWIKQAWADIGQFFYDLWLSIKTWASNTWTSIVTAWNNAGAWFSNNVIEPIKRFFTAGWLLIKTKANEAWAGISAVWITVKTWFTEHVTEPLKEAFKTALDSIKQKFETIFTGIKSFVKGVINSIIDLINGMLSGFTNGINSIIGNLNKIGGKIVGWKDIPAVISPQIPRLATGAVIPPNSQFLAVLGDQRHGTNIEAPADLIRQIVREETQSMGGQDITINFAGSLAQLIQTLNPEIKRENTRIGKSLIASTS